MLSVHSTYYQQATIAARKSMNNYTLLYIKGFKRHSIKNGKKNFKMYFFCIFFGIYLEYEKKHAIFAPVKTTTITYY